MEGNVKYWFLPRNHSDIVEFRQQNDLKPNQKVKLFFQPVSTQKWQYTFPHSPSRYSDRNRPTSSEETTTLVAPSSQKLTNGSQWRPTFSANKGCAKAGHLNEFYFKISFNIYIFFDMLIKANYTNVYFAAHPELDQ